MNPICQSKGAMPIYFPFLLLLVSGDLTKDAKLHLLYCLSGYEWLSSLNSRCCPQKNVLECNWHLSMAINERLCGSVSNCDWQYMIWICIQCNSWSSLNVDYKKSFLECSWFMYFLGFAYITWSATWYSFTLLSIILSEIWIIIQFDIRSRIDGRMDKQTEG